MWRAGRRSRAFGRRRVRRVPSAWGEEGTGKSAEGRGGLPQNVLTCSSANAPSSDISSSSICPQTGNGQSLTLERGARGTCLGGFDLTDVLDRRHGVLVANRWKCCSRSEHRVVESSQGTKNERWIQAAGHVSRGLTQLSVEINPIQGVSKCPRELDYPLLLPVIRHLGPMTNMPRLVREGGGGGGKRKGQGKGALVGIMEWGEYSIQFTHRQEPCNSHRDHHRLHLTPRSCFHAHTHLAAHSHTHHCYSHISPAHHLAHHVQCSRTRNPVVRGLQGG